jgi:hypothetical protein
MDCTDVIGPLNSKVGAIISDGQYFVTSANQHYIFVPLLGNQHQIWLYSDSCYGDDNPLLWPQPYIPYHCHLGAISQEFSLPLHQIMWWTLISEHFLYYMSPLSPISGIGKLSFMKLADLNSSITFFLNCVKLYEVAMLSEHHPINLKPLVKWLEHTFAQL